MKKRFWILVLALSLSGLLHCGGEEFVFSDEDSSDNSIFQAESLAFYSQVSLVSPVENTPVILSTFGPRLQNDVYDFHRGIDIAGDLGDPIVAVADAEIYRVYAEGSSAFPNGGNVVVLKHTLENSVSFQNQNHTQYFSVYMHLDGFSEKVQTALESENTLMVTAGESLGTMGQSGTAENVHLHFEIRVGTFCSLSYQTANPDADCASAGFDPHIHPLDFFLDETPNETDYSLSLAENDNVLEIDFTAIRPFFNLEEIEIVFSDSVTQDEVLTQTFNFNTRTGFDATSSESLDDQTLSLVTIEPSSLGESRSQYQIRFSVDLSQVVADSVEVRAKTTQGFLIVESLSF